MSLPNELSLLASLVTLVLGGWLGFLLGRRTIRLSSLIDASFHEMREAKDAAERASQAKSQFLANMSHELRTPLSAILGCAERLVQSGLGENDRQRFLTVMNHNGHLLSELINDLLDLSRVESGKMRVERTEVALDDLLREIETFLEIHASSKGITFAIHPEDTLPESIHTDPTRLRQILMNILGNAVKFTPTGGQIRVKVRLLAPTKQESEAKFSITVSDTGCGIAREERDSLFQPFSQGDGSTTRRYGGTGLGLALSRKLAMLLGGNVNLVFSRPGEGSIFNFTVHAGTPEELAQKARCPQSVIGDGAPSLIGMKILIAEDCTDIGVLLQQALERMGARAKVVGNGLAAVEEALLADFDIVLLDIQMPVLDGHGAVKRLRHLGYQKPVLALTAHALTEERRESLKSGFTDHITKPITHTELARVILRHAKPKIPGRPTHQPKPISANL